MFFIVLCDYLLLRVNSHSIAFVLLSNMRIFMFCWRVKPIIKFNPDADGDNHDENEFPFANETFYCTNDKLKKLGIKFTPLIKGLKEDYENYYKDVI